ncbi:phage holin, lambda family [Hafnia alvei]|uniref:phage holin, lambda family n=2 Tax=Hafniaceae TaxID=1903412 RepID=UPI000621CE18|nr:MULTISPECIES: phage holin, lambda family [Hafnia]ANC41743.1 holin [Hafnia alvei]KKI44945.1 holin [Hafnia alvei]TBL88196.1 phage holin, lambda family [Hafnia alvei]
MKMDKTPDLWALILAWLAGHKSEGSYSALAFLVAFLRGVYSGDSPVWRRLLDAALCAVLAFFIKDALMLLGVDTEWSYIGSVFIGFLGIDYFSSLLRRVVGNKAGLPPQQ